MKLLHLIASLAVAGLTAPAPPAAPPLAAPSASAAQDDPAEGLESDRVEERLAAVGNLEEFGHEDAEKLLLGALKDDDWEVVERAAKALAVRGEKDSVKALVKLAAEGAVRRIRHQAARSVIRLDPEDGLERLAKQVKGKRIRQAASALAAGLEELEGEADPPKLDKLLKDKNGDVRAAAARAMTLLDASPEKLAKLFDRVDVRVRAGALEALLTSADVAQLDPVAALLADGQPTDVVARRAVAVFAKLATEDGARAAIDRLPAFRGAELGASLLVEPLEAARQDLARELAERAAGDEDVNARAMAALVFERLGEGEIAALRELAADPEARVRLRAVQALGHVDAAASQDFLTGLLASDPDANVRREVATALGGRTTGGALPALVKALEDEDWGVAACAAVSIGKLSGATSVMPLERLYADAEDWRLRASAVVGLGLIYKPEALPGLIAAMDDDDPVVVLCAHEALRRLTSRLEIEATQAAWQAWYDDGGSRVRFTHPEDDAEQREKYGYGVPDSEIYRGLDVVVLQSRGDHIEELLERLEIEHRLTQASRVRADRLHPDAIFVANCTGEIENADVELLEWFVLTGGQMFGSCWALTETIGRTFPGIVAKVDTKQEVLDDVEAFPCVDQSPFLTNVFPAGTRPIYNLEGAHLLEILAPERAEVLIDSPDAADTWGEGNLAAWFDVGHGSILDSVNHFDLQGLAAAPNGLKPDERRAYAVDHMGISYERLRELDASKEDVWKNSARAAREVPDLSAFRFITNFVRRKRAGEL